MIGGPHTLTVACRAVAVPAAFVTVSVKSVVAESGPVSTATPVDTTPTP